jgi:F0F1-type ATP synthase membrane subunit c/vacuolar-type H+-ATPase subunit K
MQQAKILWFAIAFSTVIYAVVAYTIAGQPQQSFEQSVRNPITLVMYLAAISAFAAGLVVPRLLQRAPAQTRTIMGLAIFETCAIFALVAAFISHDWRLYLPGWALALIGFMRLWPGSEEVSAPGSSRRPL